MASDALSHSGGQISDAPGAGAHLRVHGIDLARALAIVGMAMVHVGPTTAQGLLGQLYALPHGRAAILFVFLAGVGVSLLASSRSHSTRATRLRLLSTAIVLLILGLALQLLDHGVRVVLATYGVLFALAIGLVGVSSRWLLGLAGFFFVAGPVGYLASRMTTSGTFYRSPVALTDPLPDIVERLLLSGPYPIITWIAPFLFGMWLARQGLHRKVLTPRMIGGGVLAAVLAFALSYGLEAAFVDGAIALGWDRILIRSPHSQMPAWLVGATGSAVAVLGVSLVIARVVPRLSYPLVAMGRLALSFYVGHLLALHYWRAELTASDPVEAFMIVLAMTGAAAAVSAMWLRVFSRGPLEGLLARPWRLQDLPAARRRPRFLGK